MSWLFISGGQCIGVFYFTTSVPSSIIFQRLLSHSNVSETNTYVLSLNRSFLYFKKKKKVAVPLIPLPVLKINLFEKKAEYLNYLLILHLLT